MKTIVDATDADFQALYEKASLLKNNATAEPTAQEFVNLLYDYFEESLLLLRAFVTVPYSKLPLYEREFVNNKAAQTQTSHLINDNTPILTLLGTRGQQDGWNDRFKSEKFMCIPMPSSEFVASLSMLAKLFQVMKLDLRMFDEWNNGTLTTSGLADISGLLYVKDAGIDKDELGRMIIPAQDFVSQYNCKTVFGYGIGYPEYPAFMTIFAFTKEVIDESKVRKFTPLVEAYKQMTARPVKECSIFN